MKIILIALTILIASCSADSNTTEKEVSELETKIAAIESMYKQQEIKLAEINRRLHELIQKAMIPAPIVKPFADNRDWMLVENLEYTIGDTGIKIKIPKGFVTDFASIPKWYWHYGLSPHGRYSKAAIVHDYLYWVQCCTKKQADNILLIAMKESGVPAFDRIKIHRGVQLRGGRYWKLNEEARKKNMPKVIPENYQNFPANLTWNDYRQILISESVTDPEFDTGESYCKYGDSGEVPR